MLVFIITTTDRLLLLLHSIVVFNYDQRKDSLAVSRIREVSNSHYLKRGWYLDKTHDRSDLLERKYFSGDFMVEKHLDK